MSSLKNQLFEFERKVIVEACEGRSIDEAAKLLGVSRAGFYRLRHKHQIKDRVAEQSQSVDNDMRRRYPNR